MQRQDQGRAHILMLDGLTDRTGRPLTTAIIASPDRGRGELNDRLERAIDRLGELDDAMALAKKDTSLNEVEREKRVAPRRAAANRAVEAAVAHSQQTLRATAERPVDLFDADEIAAIDAEKREATRVLESALGIQRVLVRAYAAVPPSARIGESSTYVAYLNR
jgi:hypothetical protein